ncbi:MAG: DUF484 family protein [Chromatiales bacterium]|jgi:uncharacterized protein YigA (DUF484 family)|nr:DUF484 family protein [Chromatiales bacterium]
MTNLTEKPPVHDIGADDVEQYLRNHPEFFSERSELLREITLPHATGGAVSLVERQVAALREQNRGYRRQLQQLMDVARSNDELLGRLQQLTLRILDGATLADALTALEESLRADFNADAAGLQFFTSGELPAYGPRAFLRISAKPTSATTGELRRLLVGVQPICGRLKGEQLAELFGEHASVISSTALLPLTVRGRLIGALAIGSHSADRFNPDMGTTYLRHLCELIAHRLAPFVPEDAPTSQPL